MYVKINKEFLDEVGAFVMLRELAFLCSHKDVEIFIEGNSSEPVSCTVELINEIFEDYDMEPKFFEVLIDTIPPEWEISTFAQAEMSVKEIAKLVVVREEYEKPFVMDAEPRPSDSYKEGVRRMMKRGKW